MKRENKNDEYMKNLNKIISEMYSNALKQNDFVHIKKNYPKRPREINLDKLDELKNYKVQLSIEARPPYMRDEYHEYNGEGGFRNIGRNQIVIIPRFTYGINPLDPTLTRGYSEQHSPIECLVGSNVSSIAKSKKYFLRSFLERDTELLRDILDGEGLESFVTNLVCISDNYIKRIIREEKPKTIVW
jgi:hypothetical protein